ncbi:xanthine dehydrogenase family protein molybdopterin-binding subunit [Paucibacter sp. PLA-PC-4]|uniref:xanthine dehydrogenase family protein molybdopterin-binding subunit n=1 Tax=Paucibacter sp. PLA-PC-4 TaxID=2993655 RepID=UPI00224B7ECB|nr:xanthine dehydrogenase family protein molybdopterin-binding subunit [Paucibacter sp. PLA-PC-4]MCX2864364.1 xanthine dehydrogenase family protein molybdopterin-binding subunit [Paucibacter sp. PLA-PC-4]
MPTEQAAIHDVACAGFLRVEDPALLSGRGRFVGDIRLAGQAHAVFVRSPHAHARLLGLEMAQAQAQPGVLAVLGPADFVGLRQPRVNRLLADMNLPEAELVPPDRVLAVGAPVALVLAESRAQAQAAADLVWADYQDLAPALDHQQYDAPALYPGLPDNVALRSEFSVGRLPESPPAAEAQIALPRVAPAPMEPRAALLSWDGQGLHAWLSTQTPSRAREDLALALGLALEQVRVVAPDVGGAFGGKASVFPEDLMLAWAARRLCRPLLWQATRGEDLLSATHGRAARLQGRLWLDADGHLAALQADLRFALGHWLTYSAAAPLRNACRILPGPYRVPVQAVCGEGRLSNAAAVGIYRGAGRPEAALLMERLIDEAAAGAGLDPLALRLRNCWAPQQLPTDWPNGQRLDACDLPALLRRAAELFGYEERRADQARRRAAGELLGLGIALYVEPCGQGFESVRLTAHADGRYLLSTGATAQGQGRETSYALIAAQALGCAPADIRVLHGDTATCPVGIGALASRSTAIGGSAVLKAAQQLRAELAAGAARPHTVDLVHEVAHEAWAAGCVMLALAIDRETGQPRIEDLVWVDDAGQVVAPALVHGQLIGGLAQGLGQGLMERLVYDEQGQLLTGSLMDYALPRADDMPARLRLASLPTRSAANALGAKGVGEAGCIGAPAALLNAAHDALRPLGGRPQLDFPLTAERLWRALHQDNTQSKP